MMTFSGSMRISPYTVPCKFHRLRSIISFCACTNMKSHRHRYLANGSSGVRQIFRDYADRYRGRTPRDAGKLIDYCHGRRGENAPNPAHPRGHVSNPTTRGPQDSVERYSFSGRKTGFFIKEDQDIVVHEFLNSSNGQEAMEELNQGSDKEAITKSISRFNLNTGDWLKGELLAEFTAKEAVLVLQHQAGMKRDQEADVHILSCYPKRL